MSALVTIAVGSNIDPKKNISKAMAGLSEQLKITDISKIYQTPPVGLLDQADFYNLCVRCETTLAPEFIKNNILRPIESNCGRVRSNEPNSPRTIDLDIILYDDLITSESGLKLPDPDICRFAHIAVPLADIAGQENHPITHQSYSDIAAPFRAQFRELEVKLNALSDGVYS